MAEVAITGRVGPDVLGDGAQAKVRQGRNAEVVVQELHGRFYESNFRGAVYSGGMALTGINAATFTTGTLGATATPIAGVYNPSGSGVNLVLVRATLGLTMTALQATGPGPFMWCASVGNGAVSTGAQPLSRSTLVAAGSKARDMSGVALTGLTNNLVARFASTLAGGSGLGLAFLATQAGMQTQAVAAPELFDGELIVPPGGVLALLATVTPVAHSATSGLVWEEVPV